MDYGPLLRDHINIQQEAISSLKKWVVSIVVIGVSIILVSFLLGSVVPEIRSDFIKIGGAFVCVLAAVPYKDIISRKEKIASYQFILQGFDRETWPQDDKQLFMEHAKKVIEETVKK